MHNDLQPDETSVVSGPQDKTQDATYVEGMATGCLGCFGAVVLSIIGFVAGSALGIVAHEREWFYTQEEFESRHGLFELVFFFRKVMTGGFVGAVLLPVVGAYVYALHRLYKTRG